MPIRTECPRCGAVYHLPEHLLGKTLRCKECEHRWPLEAAAESSKPAADREDAIAAAPPRPAAAAKPAQPSRRDADEDSVDDPLPRKRRKKATGSKVALLFVFIGLGSLLALGAVGYGIYFAITALGILNDSHKEAQAPPPPLPDPQAGMQIGGPLIPAGPQAPAVSTAEPADLVPAGLLPDKPLALHLLPPARLVPPDDPKDPMAGRGGPMSPEVLARVKKATLYLRVTMGNGQVGSGSGFFSLEPGCVVTNAHVVGMLHPLSTAPRQIDVVANSGEADERKFVGRLVAVDRTTDLAVVRIIGANLPAPLAVSSADLYETQPVWVFGFPFGENLGKNITISQTSISSLRREGGVLQKVQVNGGMHPGNSGGPVVDSRGRVVGVAVSVILTTQINFAVPGDYVATLLHGRLSTLRLGQPYQDGANVRVAVTVDFIDPLKKVRLAGVDCWTGPPPPAVGNLRPASVTLPTAWQGDSPRQTAELKVEKAFAEGEITLPALPAGKTYWVQVRYGAAADSLWWAPAAVYQAPPAIERKPAVLAVKHEQGVRPLEVLERSVSKVHGLLGGESLLKKHVTAKLEENTQAVDPAGTADVHLQYQGFLMSASENNQPHRNFTVDWMAANPHLLAADVRVDKEGNVVKSEEKFREVPPVYRQEAALLGQEVHQSLESLAVPLPGGTAEPGKTWQAKRYLVISVPGTLQTVELDMKYTYLGLRVRGGREEAVIVLEGTLKPQQQSKARGRTHGTAMVDLTTGQLVLQRQIVEFEMEAIANGLPGQATGALELQLRRGMKK